MTEEILSAPDQTPASSPDYLSEDSTLLHPTSPQGNITSSVENGERPSQPAGTPVWLTIVTILLLLTPIFAFDLGGLYSMWRGTKWSKNIKWLITTFVVVRLVIGAIVAYYFATAMTLF